MEQKVLDFFNGDELASSVWERKYKYADEKTPIDMHQRHIGEIGEIENTRRNELEKIIRDLSSNQYSNVSTFGKKIVNHLLEGKSIISDMINFENVVLGGSMLQGIGNHKLYSTLSNCFVLGQPFDSYAGINKKEDEITQVMKRRGGTGLDLSTIRPVGAKIHNQASFSSGPVLFAEGYSNKTKQVAQLGRRGALMLSLSINHPDSFDWIEAKQDLSRITGANISIKISDAFMQAVESEDDTYVLCFPVDKQIEISVLEEIKKLPYNETYECEGRIYKKIHAKDYWDRIIECAWTTAEPGVIFEGNWIKGGLDYIYPQYRPISTNPCSEIPMQPYDACRLLALNLYTQIENPFELNAKIDKNKLYELFYKQLFIGDFLIDLEIKYINRILDKIDADDSPEELKQSEKEIWLKIKETALKGRRIGAGFLSLGDMLAALNSAYYNPVLIESIFKVKMEAELDATIDLAILFGSFDGFDKNLEKQSPYNVEVISKEFPTQYDRMLEHGRRNISWSTAAPTGSLSILTQTTSGIEPLYQPFYMRRKKVTSKDEKVDYIDPADGQEFTEFFVLHQPFIKWFSIKYDIEFNEAKQTLEKSTQKELDDIFNSSPWCGQCANDLKWEERVKIQSIIQKYTTHAISSTINLPNDVDKSVISNIYLESWKKGLKGNTVYRDGSRGGVLVSVNDKKIQNNVEDFVPTHAIKRPIILPGNYHTIRVKGKVYSIIIGLMNNLPYEIFILSGNNIELPQSFDENDFVSGEIIKDYKDWYNFEAETFLIKELTDMEKDEKLLSMMLSGMLRHRAPLKYVIKIIEKTKPFAGSFNHKLSKILSKYIPDSEISTEKCPECGGKMKHENGCVLCSDCGWSKC